MNRRRWAFFHQKPIKLLICICCFLSTISSCIGNRNPSDNQPQTPTFSTTSKIKGDISTITFTLPLPISTITFPPTSTFTSVLATETLEPLEPKGTIIYTNAIQNFMAIDLATGETRYLIKPPDLNGIPPYLISSIQATSNQDIYFLLTNQKNQSDIYRIRPMGGSPIGITSSHDVVQFLIAPDGRHLAYVAGYTTFNTPPPMIIVLDLRTGLTKTIYKSIDKNQGFSNLSWSPDSSLLAFMTGTLNTDLGVTYYVRLFVINLVDEQIIELGEGKSVRENSQLNWLPDNHTLVTVIDKMNSQESGIYSIDIENDNYHLIYGPEPYLQLYGLTTNGRFLLFDPTPIREGKNSKLILLDLQTQQTTIIHTDDRQFDYNPIWNPEENQIAYFTGYDRDILQLQIYEPASGRRYIMDIPGEWMPSGMRGAWLPNYP